MPLKPDEVTRIKNIALTGVGLILDARNVSVTELKSIVSQALEGGGVVTIRHAYVLTTNELNDILTPTPKDHVVLDFS